MLRIVRSVFVIPFTAGQTFQRNDGTFSHDGSISGIVLLLGILVMVVEVLLAGSSSEAEKISSVDIVQVISNIWTILATGSCLVVTAYFSHNRNIVMNNTNWDTCTKIKLRFLWIFTLARTAHGCLYLTSSVDCLHMRYSDEKNEQEIVSIVFIVIFSLIQTGFLTFFCQYKFHSNLTVYYSLLVIFMGNISIFVSAFVNTLKEIQEDTNNVTINSHTDNISCSETSSFHKVVQKVRPFLEPTVCENALLSILFLIEMWPNTNIHSFTYDQLNRRPHDSHTYLTINETHGGDEDPYEEVVIDENSPIYRRHSYKRNDILSRHFSYVNSSHRTRKFLGISFPVLINIPAIVLYGLKINGNKNLTMPLNVYNDVALTLTFIFVVKCFYDMQAQCIPTSNFQSLNGHDKMLITSYLGTLAYYTMRLSSNIFLIPSGDIRYAVIYQYIVYIFSTYFQTIFLLQMRNYEKIGSRSTLFSIEYTTILLSFDNLITWFIDTFISSQYVFRSDASFQLYGRAMWIGFYTFLFPFVIFFRFKCFVLYYGLFDRLRQR